MKNGNIANFAEKVKAGKIFGYISVLLAFIAFQSYSGIAYAQSVASQIDNLSQMQGVDNASGQAMLTSKVASVSLGAAVVVLMAMGINGGYKLLTSAGNPEKLMEAKEILTNAFLGFLVIALAVSILTVVDNVFGLNIGAF